MSYRGNETKENMITRNQKMEAKEEKPHMRDMKRKATTKTKHILTKKEKRQLIFACSLDYNLSDLSRHRNMKYAYHDKVRNTGE